MYRVGIIGTGGISRRHAMGYEATRKAEIVAISDFSPENLSKAAAKWGVDRIYGDYREMLAREQLDLVSVCTWEDSHAEIVVAAAESGARGVLCEKPMAMNLSQADQMIETCEQNGVKLAIGHMRRYMPSYIQGRDLIQSGELGDILMMWAYCGGDMFLWGTHHVDMLFFLNGDRQVRSVMGQIDWSKRGMGYPYSERFLARRCDKFVAEDDAIGMLEFDNGVRALFQTGQHSPKRHDNPLRLSSEIEVVGTWGVAYINERHVGYLSATSGGWVESKPLTEEEFEQRWNKQFADEIDDLCDCVTEDREHYLSGYRGRAVLEVMMAIYESSRRRAEVELPLQVQDNSLLTMIERGEIPYDEG